jgi:hypothetical protein
MEGKLTHWCWYCRCDSENDKFIHGGWRGQDTLFQIRMNEATNSKYESHDGVSCH